MADQSYKVPDMPTSSEVAGAMAEGQEQAACNDTGVHNLANINKSKDAFYFYQGENSHWRNSISPVSFHFSYSSVDRKYQVPDCQVIA